MTVRKGPGNLRDFRIHETFDTSSTTEEKTAKQSVQLKQNTLNEWTQHSSKPTALEELWPTWNEDLSVELSPLENKPVSKTKEKESPQIQLSTDDSYAKPWATELALIERRMEQKGEVDLSPTMQKQDLLRLKTLEFTKVLHENFRQNIEIFNEMRRSQAHTIRVFRISGTKEDFMLFRNGIKLLISGQKTGRISFTFNQFMGQQFSSQAQAVTELEAAWGPFDHLFWTYKNERIQVADVVRYFLTEFTKQSLR